MQCSVDWPFFGIDGPFPNGLALELGPGTAGRVMNKPNKGNNTDQQQQGAGDKAAEGKPAAEAPAKEEAKSSA